MEKPRLRAGPAPPAGALPSCSATLLIDALVSSSVHPLESAVAVLALFVVGDIVLQPLFTQPVRIDVLLQVEPGSCVLVKMK